MALFSQHINEIPGLRFIADELQLQSPLGRQHLLKQRFMTSPKEIAKHLDKVEEIINFLVPKESPTNIENQPQSEPSIQSNNTPTELLHSKPYYEGSLQSLKHALSEIRDITGTLNALHTGMTLDDIGLFEIKRFALIIDRLIGILNDFKSNVVNFTSVSQIISILDPDKQRVPNFYIYDSYSEELAGLRKEYQRLTHETLSREYHDDPKGKRKSSDLQLVEELRLKTISVEDEIRKDISKKLRGYSIILLENLSAAADLDLWLAKALLAHKLGLCKPAIINREQQTTFRQLFNPAVRHILQMSGKEFQPVDIKIIDGPTVITGANMAGKTVVLKTVALAQALFQYGFYVPATKAEIVPVEKIMTSMEDEQSELKGLSSFAAEMLKLNNIISAARNQEQILALIDEPAKTTNPREGEALVSALIELLNQYKISSFITTHYSIESPGTKRLRVAGIKTSELNESPSIGTIQDYIDYSLIEVDESESNKSTVPEEALTIAKLLKVDKELLNIAEQYLKNNLP
jgi:DNA mismatch repair protein MutS2